MSDVELQIGERVSSVNIYAGDSQHIPKLVAVAERLLQGAVEVRPVEDLQSTDFEKAPNSLTVIDVSELEDAEAVITEYCANETEVRGRYTLILTKSRNVGDLIAFASIPDLDFMCTPFTVDQFQARLAFLLNRVEPKSQQINGVAGQVGELPDYSEFADKCCPIYASAQRDQIDICLGLIEISNLSDIEQQYGKATVQDIFNSISDLIRLRLRSTDLVCRYSEGVFAFLLVNMRETHLETYLDDLILACLATTFDVGQEEVSVEVDVGATTLNGLEFSEMMDSALTALEQSKLQGESTITILGVRALEARPVFPFPI